MSGKTLSLKQYLLQTPSAFQNKQIHAVSKNISAIGDIPKEFLKATNVYLSYNMIDDTTSLIQFQKCTTLSLGSNNINSLHDIDNLELMTGLKHLRLDQNPISYFPTYRMYTINTLPNLLSLDGQRISEKERAECAYVIKQEREQFQLICNVVSEYLLLQQQLQINNDHMSIINPYSSNEQFVYQEIIDMQHKVGKNKSWRDIYQMILQKYKQQYDRLQRGDINYNDELQNNTYKSINNQIIPVQSQIGKTQVLQSNGQLISKSRAEIIQKSVMYDQSMLPQQQPPVVIRPQLTEQLPQQPFQAIPQQFIPQNLPQYHQFPTPIQTVPAQEQVIQQPVAIPYQPNNIQINQQFPVPIQQPASYINTYQQQISIPQNIAQQEMQLNDLDNQKQVQQNPQQHTPEVTEERVDKALNEKLEKLEQQINDQRIESAKQAQELEKAQQLNKELQMQIKLLQSQNESLETQVLGQTKRDADQNQQICQLQIKNQELEEKTQNYDQLTKTNTEIQSKYNTLKETNAKLKTEVEQQKIQIQDYTLIKEERNQYQAKVKQLKEQKQNLEKQLDDYQAQISKQNVRIKYQEEQSAIKQQQLQKEIDQKLKIQSEAIVLAKQLTKMRNIEIAKKKIEKLQLQKVLQSFCKGVKLQKYDEYVFKSIQIKVKSRIILNAYKNIKIMYSLSTISRNINIILNKQLIQYVFKIWKSKSAGAISDLVSDAHTYQQFKVIDKRYNGRLVKRIFKIIKVVSAKSKFALNQLNTYQNRVHKQTKLNIFNIWRQRQEDIIEKENIIYQKHKKLTINFIFSKLWNMYIHNKDISVQITKTLVNQLIIKSFKQIQLIYQCKMIARNIQNLQEHQWLIVPFQKFREIKQQEQQHKKLRFNTSSQQTERQILAYMQQRVKKQIKCKNVSDILNMNMQMHQQSKKMFYLRTVFTILKLKCIEKYYEELKGEYENTNIEQLKDELENIKENKSVISNELKAILESKSEIMKKYEIIKQELVRQLHKNKEMKKKIQNFETIGQQVVSPKFNDREHELEILVNQYQLQNQTLLVKLAGKDQEIQKLEQIMNNGVRLDANKIALEENERAQQQLLHEEEKRVLKMQIQQQEERIQQKDQLNKQMREELRAQNKQLQSTQNPKKDISPVNFTVKQRENQQDASSDDSQDILEGKYSEALKQMQQDSMKSNTNDTQKDGVEQ